MRCVSSRSKIDYRNLGFWDRFEVRNAVRHGRRVDDRALAPIAVGFAQRVQETGGGWSWSLGDSLIATVLVAHAAVAAFFLPWWTVLPVAVALVIVAGFRYERMPEGTARERAEEAEEANRWVVEKYELLDDRSRAALRPRRFRAVRRLVA
jgi:hypothetical protein